MNIKNLILIIAIIVVVVGVTIFLISHIPHPKADSKIVMTSNATLTEGDNFTVKLTDSNGTPLSNQNINVTIVSGSNGSVQKSLVSDANGEAGFEVDTSATGNCAVMIKYAGNDEFNGCNMTENVRIEKKVVVIDTNSTNILGNNTTYSYVETYEDAYSNYYYDGDVETYVDY